MKLAIVLLGLFLVADAAIIDDALDDYEQEVQLETRRAKSCRCPKLNTELQCKKNQKKNKFYTDDECKCPHYRCIWTVCPKIVKPECEPCQKLIEVEDCGCKSFECQNIQPNHCELKPVECKPCEKLEQTKDECGCPQEKCVPLQNPPSQCGSCNPCEKCVGIPTGPKECGLKQEVCKRNECPHFKEVKCDPDCEEPEFGETKCGCPFMKCKKLSPLQDVPQCKPCHELRKIKIEKCGIEKFQCVPSPCKGPPAGKEVCYKSNELDVDSCGCRTFERKKCDVVPAGDCPEGSQAEGGSDLCGCPHQVCVPCSQMYPEEKCDKKCQRKEEKKVSDKCTQIKCTKVNSKECGPGPCDVIKDIKQEKQCPHCEVLVDKEMGQPGEGCIVKVCVKDLDDPKCRPCVPSKPASCGVCKVSKEVPAADGCKVSVCVPSEADECKPPPPCPNKGGKPRCNKCQKAQKVKLWDGCYKEICEAKSAMDCKQHEAPKCPDCQTAVAETDECGCKKYTCKPKICAKASKDDITCPKDQKKNTPALGVDKCKCPVPTCVSKPEICEGAEVPKGYTVGVAGRAYKVHEEGKTWQEANDICKNSGGQLVEPDNDEVNKYLATLSADNIWIGASDNGHEGRFTWASNGKNINMNKWHPGEPNNCCGGQNCAVTNFNKKGHWDDAGCSLKNKFVCQFKP